MDISQIGCIITPRLAGGLSSGVPEEIVTWYAAAHRKYLRWSTRGAVEQGNGSDVTIPIRVQLFQEVTFQTLAKVMQGLLLDVRQHLIDPSTGLQRSRSTVGVT